MENEKDIKKAEIRKQILEKRMLLLPEEWEMKSTSIHQQVGEHPDFLRAKQIFTYVSMKREVDTYRLMEMAWQMGKQIAVPKIQGQQMRFYYITAFDQLEPGYFGVMEPVDNGTEAQADETTLILMPGVAFDRNRNRIGYGGGYYDRYLAGINSVKTMAIGFELQLLDLVPVDRYDRRPDTLISELGCY